ncbi:MAG: fibronectin type III domain-containing protein [Myxococcales bacterium]
MTGALLLATCAVARPARAQSVPSEPTALTATPGNASATLKWAPPTSDGGSPITAYYVWCNGAGTVIVLQGNQYTKTVTGMQNGRSYNCQVNAVNAVGQGQAIFVTALPVAPPTPPATPQGLNVAAQDAQASCTWAASTSNGGPAVTGYSVTASPGGLTCTTTGDLSCTIAGLSNGTLYSFTVTATNADGTSAPSKAFTATVGFANTAPTAPTSVSAAPNGSAAAVLLTWGEPASNGGSTIKQYQVDSSPALGNCAVPTNSDGTPKDVTKDRVCVFSSLKASTSYSFTVTAINDVGKGAASSPVTFLSAGVPGAPTALKATAGSNSVTLNWAAPTSDGGAPISSYTTTCGAVSAAPTGIRYTGTLAGLAAGVQVTCTVFARNTMGNGASATITAVPLAPPPTTSFVQVAPPSGKTFTSASVGDSAFFGGIAAGEAWKWGSSAWSTWKNPSTVALSQIAYGKGGELWVLDVQGRIWSMVYAPNWTSVSGTLKQISVGSADNVWGVNAGGNIYKWNRSTTKWSQMPGLLGAVSVAADGTVWGLAQDYKSILRWNGTAFVTFTGTLNAISAGSASNVWGVTASGTVYKLNAAGTGWGKPLVPTGAFVNVSVASDGTVLLLRNDGTVWKGK